MGASRRARVNSPPPAGGEPTTAALVQEAMVFLARRLVNDLPDVPGIAHGGLSRLQLRVLMALEQTEEGLGLDDLGRRLGLSPPSASRLCQRMERDGLLVRDSGPGRSVVVGLTAHGTEQLTNVDLAWAEQLHQLVDGLPPSVRRVLAAELSTPRPEDEG